MRPNFVLSSCQIAFTYLGAIIGAGFATGQEIVNFFAAFGPKGIIAAIISGMLFAILGCMVVSVVSGGKMKNYKEYINFLFTPKIAWIFDALLFMFLCCGLTVMLVASSSLCTKMLDMPAWAGFLFTAGLLYISLLMGEEGLLWLNTALVPGIILLVLFIAAHTVCENPGAVQTALGNKNLLLDNWLLSSVLYTAYNLVLGMVVLSSLGGRSLAASLVGTASGGIVLGLLAAFICKAVLISGQTINSEEIPMLSLAARISPGVVRMYFFVLWAAILTTALSNGFGLVKRIHAKLAMPRPVLVFLIFLPCLPFINWSLSGAIGIIYPLLGYIGLIFITAIIYKTLRLAKEKISKRK